MIGALEFAKDYLKNSIMSGAGVSGAEICRKKETEYTTENTKAVSKEEAISLYLDAYETIKARLSIIAASDDRTEYQVPESLKTL